VRGRVVFGGAKARSIVGIIGTTKVVP
jgi:hypothetical protein